MSEQRRIAPRPLARAYRALALLAFNTLLAVLAVNLAAAAALTLFRAGFAPPPGPLSYGLDRLAPLYPGRSPAEVEALLRETWSREYVYAPFVQHRERESSGRFVNVEAAGFRRSAGQGPWPPRPELFNVFVFGGSTTFGYGLADAETVPSRLQAALAELACSRPPRVYNFGRGNYYSQQERVLFEELVSQGLVPDVALFIDGLNEFKADPKFTRRLEYLMGESDGALWRRALRTLPVVELLRVVRGDGGSPEGQDGAAAAEAEERALAERVVARWRRNRQMIQATAEAFGARALFVWQPVPVYRYRLELHPFADQGAALFAGFGALRRGYETIDRERPDGDDFLWLADIQQGRREALYVDAAHYSAAFSDEIARQIAAFLAPGSPCDGAAAP